MEFNVGKITKTLNSELFKSETGFDLYQKDDGDIYIKGCKTQKEAESLLAAHNPTSSVENSLEQKLSNAGITLDELKTALGL